MQGTTHLNTAHAMRAAAMGAAPMNSRKVTKFAKYAKFYTGSGSTGALFD
jgi:hypothetical protein